MTLKGCIKTTVSPTETPETEESQPSLDNLAPKNSLSDLIQKAKELVALQAKLQQNGGSLESLDEVSSSPAADPTGDSSANSTSHGFEPRYDHYTRHNSIFLSYVQNDFTFGHCHLWKKYK